MMIERKATLYKERQIMTASPLDLVVLAYDAALMGCAAKETWRALEALSELRKGLNWEAAPEIAPRLQAIYEFCEECVRKGDFEVTTRILRELRETWVEVRRRVNVQAARAPARPVVAGMSAFSLAG
jgi:flagellin-specific chaperone FliS